MIANELNEARPVDGHEFGMRSAELFDSRDSMSRSQLAAELAMLRTWSMSLFNCAFKASMPSNR